VWDTSADPAERQYAEILRKRYVDQLGYDQIARELDLTVDSARQLMERAKYHLRKQ
jgi:DNA-directed RNA polymerase specialized sigma24 family protein